MDILFVLIILIPFSTLATMIAWIGFYKEPKKIAKFAFLYIYGIFILSYSLIPDHDLDLNRYWYQVENIKGLSLSDAVQYFNDGLYIENVVFWIVGRLNMLHLLPAITTSIVYGISTFIIIDSNKRMNLKGSLIYILLFQSILFPYLSIAANIRNICAFAIGIYAVYREMIQKRRDLLMILAYIAPIFMHKTGILILIIRLFVFVFQKTPILSLSIVLLLPSLISFFYNNVSLISFPGTIGIIVRRLIISSHNYLIGGSEYAERLSRSTAASLAKYAAIICILVQAYLLYKYYINHKDDDYAKLAIFSFLMSMVSFATTVFDTPAYWRFAMAVNISFNPILLYYFGSGRKEIKISATSFKLMMLCLAGLRFSIEAARSIPRINFQETINMLIYSNAYSIFIEFLKGLVSA